MSALFFRSSISQTHFGWDRNSCLHQQWSSSTFRLVIVTSVLTPRLHFSDLPRVAIVITCCVHRLPACAVVAAYLVLMRWFSTQSLTFWDICWLFFLPIVWMKWLVPRQKSTSNFILIVPLQKMTFCHHDSHTDSWVDNNTDTAG